MSPACDRSVFSWMFSGDGCGYQLSINYIMSTACFPLLLLMVVLVGSCPNHCLFCLGGQLCALCESSFVLATDASCLPLTVPNCRIQLNASACTVCEPTFQTSGGLCVKDYSGCLMRTPSGECRYCGFGTRLVGGGCVGVLNCQTYQPSGQCLICMPGYSLTTGSCTETRPACATRSAGVCSQCQMGYVMNGFSCLPPTFVPPGCAIFNYVSGRCFMCSEGYDIYHKYCQRKDRIPFYTPSQPPPLYALKMQEDSLDVTAPIPTAAIANTDSIVQDYSDISIRVGSGQGQSVGEQKCWEKNKAGACVVCCEGYSLVSGVCVKAAPLCLQFSGRLCAKCVPELKLSQGNCLDSNCAVPIFSRCAQCLPNYTPNVRGVCVSNNCASFQQGTCTQCSQGYTLSPNSLCVTITATPTASTTPPTITKPTTGVQTIIGCDVVVNGVCGRCGDNYYPNNKGGCKKVIIGCLQYDTPQLNCLSCIPIYTKTPDGSCVYQPNTPPTPTPAPTTTPPAIIAKTTPAVAPTASKGTVIGGVDENCLVRNNGSCAICKGRFIMNLYNFSCQAVAKECLTFNPSNGSCLSCSVGYNLFLGWCLGRFNQTDPNCLVRDINNYCSSCQPQFFLSQGRCLPADTQCRSLNLLGGDCTACYSGYVVFNGRCLPLAQQPACLNYDFQSNCLSCAHRYVLQAAVCTPVNPLCDNYHPQTASCLNCVSGFGLSSITGNCEPTQPAPPNCQTADPVGNCLACMARFYFNASNNCLPASTLCAKFENSGGKCLSCIPTHALLPDSSCVLSNLTAGCKSAGPSGQCSACITQYVLTGGGACLFRDPNCLSYDDGGSCNKCVSLYYVWQGRCVKEVLKNKDGNCRINDLLNYCMECNSGYFISAGNCLLADQLCRTFDPSNGNCLTCYSGYRLTQNKCFLGAP